MGSNCTSCKKPSNALRNKQYNKSNSKVFSENKNYLKTKSLTNSENKLNMLSQLQNYNFFNKTKFKNDYFIECNLLFVNTAEKENIAKYLEKWVQIISLSRTERKISYQNLYSEKEKTLDAKNKSSKANYSNNKNNNYNNDNNHYDIISSNQSTKKNSGLKPINDNINEFINNQNNGNDENKIISTTNNCEIKIYNNREGDKFFSDLIIKLQIASIYNKDRFVKSLSKGPPNNIRWAIWLTIALTDPTSNFLSESEYLILSEKTDFFFQQNFDDQIKKDIKRSNIGMEYLSQKNAEESLYRILKCLALLDPELGYCQGMNIITANLLMLSDCNELETFNLMLYLLKNLELREFFLNGFPKLLMFIFIFREFIKDQYPKIHYKLENLDIPEELWIFKWLQTLFFLTLPLSISVRIIDCVLCFGLEFLLNFSLSFLKENEGKIMECQSMESFIDLFKGPEIEFDEEEDSTVEDNKTNEFSSNKELKSNNYENKNYVNNKEYSKINNLNADNINENNTAAYLNDKFNEGYFDNNNNEFDKNKDFEHSKNDDNLKDPYSNFNQDAYKNNIHSIKKDELKTNDNYIAQNAYNNHRPNNYFKNFDFINDIISYRENLIREAKSLCIRDLIDKMIETYSQNNYNPLFNFNPNNVLNTLTQQDVKSNLNTIGNNLNNDNNHNNNYYDYQKTVYFKEDDYDNNNDNNENEYNTETEGTNSVVSSPRSGTSVSYNSKSIKEELIEYEEEEADYEESLGENQKEKLNIEEIQNLRINNYNNNIDFNNNEALDKHDKKSLAAYSNNDLDKNNINDEIPCKINKRRNLRLTHENIAKNFGTKKSIMFNLKSDYASYKNDTNNYTETNNSNNLNNENNNNYNKNNNLDSINNKNNNHFSNLGLCNRNSKFKNFRHSKDILLSYGDRCKSVRFDVSASNEFFSKQTENKLRKTNNSRKSNVNNIHNTNNPYNNNITESQSIININNINNINNITSKYNKDSLEYSVSNKAFNNLTSNNFNYSNQNNTEGNKSLYCTTNENLANTYNNNTNNSNNINNNPNNNLYNGSITNDNLSSINNNTYLNKTRGSTRFLGKSCVRQSLSLNFGRRLNLDQINMMNKIKSKMSIIQSMNKNESKQNIEKQNTSNYLNLNNSTNDKDKDISKMNKENKNNNNHDNGDNNEIKNYFLNEKKTLSNKTLTTKEKNGENTLQSDLNNCNNFSKFNGYKVSKLGLNEIADNKPNEFIKEPQCDSEIKKDLKIKSTENNFNNLICEKEGNSPTKRRHTSKPFKYQSSFARTDDKDSCFSLNEANNSNNNLISSLNFKNQNEKDLENTSNYSNHAYNTHNYKENHKMPVLKNFKARNNFNKAYFCNVNTNNYHKEDVYKSNINNVIIEEEQGIGNNDD